MVQGGYLFGLAMPKVMKSSLLESFSVEAFAAKAANNNKTGKINCFITVNFYVLN